MRYLVIDEILELHRLSLEQAGGRVVAGDSTPFPLESAVLTGSNGWWVRYSTMN
jgi:hypothetical protein